MGRIHQLLNEAQDGQAFANLARAFHLPAEKVEPAVAAMIGDIIAQIEDCLPSRRSLAALVELLGKNIHLQVLNNPVLLGATSTQVAGNKVLNAIAGRNENSRMAKRAAAAAGISEMISEYLLPVVASMVIGALAKENRGQLDAIMGIDADDPADGHAVEMLQLPRASGGGANFAGITGGTVGGAASTDSRYAELAEEIRRAGSASDPARQVRNVLAATLGTPIEGPKPGQPATGQAAQQRNIGTIRSFFSGWRR